MKILFIPASSPKGAGEYIRSLTVAQKIHAQWPDAELLFIINRHANYINDVPFPVRLIDKTPTLSVDAVKGIINEEKPDLCLFDSGGRTSLFAWLKSQQIPIVYLSSRNNTRRKAFRFRWLKLIDQHWIVQPLFANGPLSFWEKLKLKITGATPPVFLQTLYPESDQFRRESLKFKFGINNDKFLLFSSGGGGQRGEGPQAPDIFAKAASTVARKTGFKCIALMGPNYPGEAPRYPGVIAVKSVSNEHYVDLLHDAELVVTGGGSSLAQGMAERKLMVCAPAAADQSERLKAASTTNAIVAVKTETESLSNAVIDLIQNPKKQSRLRQALKELNLENGLEYINPLIRQLLDNKAGGMGA